MGHKGWVEEAVGSSYFYNNGDVIRVMLELYLVDGVVDIYFVVILV